MCAKWASPPNTGPSTTLCCHTKRAYVVPNVAASVTPGKCANSDCHSAGNKPACTLGVAPRKTTNTQCSPNALTEDSASAAAKRLIVNKATTEATPIQIPNKDNKVRVFATQKWRRPS